jgi:hypothetical protein
MLIPKLRKEGQRFANTPAPQHNSPQPTARAFVGFTPPIGLQMSDRTSDRRAIVILIDFGKLGKKGKKLF